MHYIYTNAEYISSNTSPILRDDMGSCGAGGQLPTFKHQNKTKQSKVNKTKHISTVIYLCHLLKVKLTQRKYWAQF